MKSWRWIRNAVAPKGPPVFLAGVIGFLITVLIRYTCVPGGELAVSRRFQGMASNKALDMRKRTVLQYLSMSEWKLVCHLPIPVGEMTVGRLVHQGWIELRGEDRRAEARLTETGLKRSRV